MLQDSRKTRTLNTKNQNDPPGKKTEKKWLEGWCFLKSQLKLTVQMKILCSEILWLPFSRAFKYSSHTGILADLPAQCGCNVPKKRENLGCHETSTFLKRGSISDRSSEEKNMTHLRQVRKHKWIIFVEFSQNLSRGMEEEGKRTQKYSHSKS